MQLLYLFKMEYDEEEILTVVETLQGFSDQRDVRPLVGFPTKHQSVELDALAA